MSKKSFFRVLKFLIFIGIISVAVIVFKINIKDLHRDIVQLEEKKNFLLKQKSFLELKLDRYIKELGSNVIKLRKRALLKAGIDELDAWQEVADSDSIDIVRYNNKKTIDSLELGSNRLYHSAGGQR